MADNADLADEVIAASTASNIEETRRGLRGPFADLRPIGRCHWCDTPVPPGRTHCSPAADSCVEDHLRQRRFNRRGY